MSDDLDFLVRETYNERTTNQGRSPFDEDLEALGPFETAQTNQDDSQGPGIIYRLEIGFSTFCLKSLAVQNIDAAFKQIETGELDIMAKLRLTEQDLKSELSLNYFSLPQWDLAQTISKQFSNRRFPIFEDRLFNISDPGFSWWLDLSSTRFGLYFKLRPQAQSQECLKVGPLGDGQMARQVFFDSMNFLSKFFPLDEYAVNDSSVSLQSGPCENFHLFQQIFAQGDVPYFMQSGIQNPEEEKLFNYFVQLALARKFWLEIESMVHKFYQSEK